MRVLLGADVIISAKDTSQDFATIGWLFQWLDKLKIKKCIDYPTCTVLSHFGNLRKQLLKNFEIIPKVYRKNPLHLSILSNYVDSNSRLSQSLPSINADALIAQLAVLEAGDADFLITDNSCIHALSRQLNIDDRVYYVSEFVDKCAFENRDADQSKGLIVEETTLSQLNIHDPFFNSFKKDYANYTEWFQRKSNDKVFVSKRKGKVIALLKLKIEDNQSEFDDISPQIIKKKLLKVSSFKIEPNRTKLAERFFRIIFNVTIYENVDGIYVTLFDNTEQKRRLRRLFEKWGFKLWGNKMDSSEIVLYRDFTKDFNFKYPQTTFPFHSGSRGVYLVSIDSTYANALLGLNLGFNQLHDIEPYKNAISKILITYNLKHNIKTGSLILFVSKIRNKKTIMGVGIVQDVHKDLKDEPTFLRICRKRSIFDDNRLKICWNRQTEDKKLSTIEFLYVAQFSDDTFPENKLSSLGDDIESLRDQEPFKISEIQFNKLINNTQYENDYIAN